MELIKGLVSVVIPTFNRAGNIVETVNSVLAQDYKNWELIIVDDGSTDDTKQIVQKLVEQYPNITFLNRYADRLKGANACRNIGIQTAKGEFVALLDSDDKWMPSHLELNISLFAAHEAINGIYGSAIINTRKRDYLRASRQLKENESLLDFLLAPDGFAPTTSLVLRTEKANDILFDETLKRHQDWDFFIKFGQKYNWSFSGSATVCFNRLDVNTNIDFESCIVFYERYRHTVTNKQNAFLYLLYTLIKAIDLEKGDKITSYYINELKKLDNDVALKYRLASKLPKTLTRILKIKRQLLNG